MGAVDNVQREGGGNEAISMQIDNARSGTVQGYQPDIALVRVVELVLLPANSDDFV